MIDVMKRLAELDSANPNIVKENAVAECGIMPGIGMEMESPSMVSDRPSTPATINMTAGSGEELGTLLKDIMSLAGMGAQHAEEPTVVAEPQTLEPVIGDETPADTMRGVIDRLNPMDGEDDGIAGLDRDHDGDHDMQDHEMEKDQEETDEGQYDNSPADPNKKNEFDANEFARRENQPGQGDRMDGNMPKAYADMNEAVSDLFAQYKKFISESEEAEEDNEEYVACVVQHNRSGQAIVQRTKPTSRARAEEVIKHALSKNTFVNPPFMTIYPASAGKLDGSTIMSQYPDMSQEGMGEGIEDRLKDLDTKNPVNVPAYQRKAASGDSADAVRNTKEGAAEKFDPLKHVKNPTQGEKDAAKDVKRGSYADRAALLRSAETDGRLKSGGQTNEDAGNNEIGQMMANDGITYSPEKENELINLMAQYMKKSGMSSKAIRYYLSYDEDYISDQLGLLPREGQTNESMSDILKLSGLK